MLAIARGLVASPKLMLVDEPTEGLSPLIVESLTEILREINRRGTTILLVEQILEVALVLSHRLYVMDQGRIQFEGRRGAARRSRHPAALPRRLARGTASPKAPSHRPPHWARPVEFYTGRQFVTCSVCPATRPGAKMALEAADRQGPHGGTSDAFPDHRGTPHALAARESVCSAGGSSSPARSWRSPRARPSTTMRSRRWSGTY